MGIPKVYQKAPDGSILRIIEMWQKDSATTVAKVLDGYTKTETNKVKRFFEDNEPPLYVELTLNGLDDVEIEVVYANGTGTLSIDKGDGVYVDYLNDTSIIFTPVGTTIFLKSVSNIISIRFIDNVAK